MNAQTSFLDLFWRIGRATMHWLLAGWRVLLFSVMVLSLTFSPSSYRRQNRHAIACQFVLGTTTNLIWFSVLSALFSLILIRIVVVTSDRKSVVSGKSVSVRVDLGGRRTSIKNKTMHISLDTCY